MSSRKGGRKRGAKKKPSTKGGASRQGKRNTQKGRLLEEVVARMHGGSRNLSVARNVAFPPLHRDSKKPPEIDVLLTGSVLGYPATYAIECKNLKGKVKKEKIDAFVGKLRDVGIPYCHGIYVSPQGYTEDAIYRARPDGVRLLTLTGLTPDGMKSITEDAAQFCIYYLAQVTSLSVTNNVAHVVRGEELLLFFDDDGKVCGSVVDLIWNKWQEGHPKSEAGVYELSLNVPRGWHQIVNGKREPVLAINATVQVWALMLTVPGRSEFHTLVNAEDGAVERSQLNVSFDVPLKGKTVHPLKAFSSETALQAFLKESKGVSVTLRRRLPRIQYVNAFFYPLSQRVATKLSEIAKDFMPGQSVEAIQRPDITELEGEDLSAMWEPLCEGYFGKAIPVIVTTDDDEAVDLFTLMRAKDYGRVVEMRCYYDRNPTPAFGELLCHAYLLQGLTLLQKAEAKEGVEAERLLMLALEKVQAALLLNPGMPEAHHDLGLVLGKLGRHEEALAAFERALQLSADRIEFWIGKGKVLAKLKRYEESLASFDRVLSADPTDTDVLFRRSYLLLQLERYEESAAGYDRVILDAPDDYLSWFFRGCSLSKLSRFEEAVDSFDHALDVEREDADVWGQRGWALHNLNRIEEAVESYSSALQLDPEAHQVLLFQGFALAHLGRFDEALDSLDKGLTHLPGDFATWNVRADVLERLDRCEEALESYTIAIDFASSNQQTWINRGLLLHKFGWLEEALNCFDEAVKIDPQNPAAWHSRGFVLYSLERDEDALADYDQVLSLTRDEFGTWSNRALCLIELNRLEEALDSANEALRLVKQPQNRFTPLLVRAKVYHRRGQATEAADDTLAAWQIEPERLFASEEYLQLYAEAYSVLATPTPAHTLLMGRIKETSLCQA